jgi:hypothetical protein
MGKWLPLHGTRWHVSKRPFSKTNHFSHACHLCSWFVSRLYNRCLLLPYIYSFIRLTVRYCPAMFILYTVAPLLYRTASSTYYNISLLTTDFYGLLFGAFFTIYSYIHWITLGFFSRNVSICAWPVPPTFLPFYNRRLFATCSTIRRFGYIFPRLRWSY